MTNYTRNQSRIKALQVNDTPEIRAMVNFVLAIEENRLPSSADNKLLAKAFNKILAGQHPKEIFGMSLGLETPKGRRPHAGFTSSEIVSAVIEIKLRRLNKAPDALPKAIKYATEVFVDVDNGPSGVRSTYRDWDAGKVMVENLTDSELAELIKPYLV